MLLQESWASDVIVTVRGVGGSTADDGWHRWRGADAPDLLIVMYGSNDAAPRRLLSRKRAVHLAKYAQALRNIVVSQQRRGGKVLLLAPPPTGARAMNARLQAYRATVLEVARLTGAAFLDPAEAMITCEDAVMLEFDATHVNQRGQNCIAQMLGKYVKMLPMEKQG